MKPSYQDLASRNKRQAAAIERLHGERDEHKENAAAALSQLERVTGELSRMKDVVALHIVAAGHPSTVLHDPKRIGEALREELAANRVDLRLELARLEGAEL